MDNLSKALLGCWCVVFILISFAILMKLQREITARKECEKIQDVASYYKEGVCYVWEGEWSER